MKLGTHSLSFIALFAAGALVTPGCGGSSNNDGGSNPSAGTVSCDIRQTGMHYCEEVKGGGDATTDTGCPKMMAGFIPGTGCSRDDVTGTCSVAGAGAYEVFFYGTAVSSSAVAAICPGGTFEASKPTGSGTSSGGAGASTTPAGTCADLQACCNKGTGALKDSCLMVYDTAMKSGDTSCAAYLPLYRLSLNCQ
jgi:hypothetical protein